nr:hypothetical protein [Tanacetum cinerariifolium]
MSSKDAKEESTKSDSDDETTHVYDSMVESYKKNEFKRFDFVTKDGEHVHLTKEQISAQKKIEEEAKAKATRREGEIKKEELIDLLGPEVVNKYYNDKLQPLSEQDPLDRLNDLENKKRKHADDIYDFFRANKRLNSSVQYKDHPAGTVHNEPVLDIMLYTIQEIFFRLHQGLELDDHDRTFWSLLLAEIDKRNLNPLKQMRVIEQLSGTETKEGLLERASV